MRSRSSAMVVKRDLYHAALAVSLDGERYTIEVTPSPDTVGKSRGVVTTGAVGSTGRGDS